MYRICVARTITMHGRGMRIEESYDGSEFSRSRAITRTSQRRDTMRSFIDRTKIFKDGKHLLLHVVLPEKPRFHRVRWKNVEERQQIYDWFALNTCDFYTEVQILFFSISDGNIEWRYLYENAEAKKNYKRGFPEGLRYNWKGEPVIVNDYVEKVLDWCDREVANEDLFPPDTEHSYPRNFVQHVRKIFKRLYRVYNIILANDCLYKKATPDNLNLPLKRFLYFGWYWGLLTQSETFSMRRRMPKLVRQFMLDVREYAMRILPYNRSEYHGFYKELDICQMKAHSICHHDENLLVTVHFLVTDDNLVGLLLRMLSVRALDYHLSWAEVGVVPTRFLNILNVANINVNFRASYVDRTRPVIPDKAVHNWAVWFYRKGESFVEKTRQIEMTDTVTQYIRFLASTFGPS